MPPADTADAQVVVHNYPDRVIVVTSRGDKGDTGPPGPAGPGVVGSAAVALAAGQPVTRQFNAASAVGGSAAAVGLALAAAGIGDAVTARTAGPLTLADWTAATGSPYLQAGAPYFVSDVTAGRIAVAVPTLAGRVVQCVGVALTTDTLVISVGNPILL